MSRRRRSKKRLIIQDPLYNSELVSQIINKILLKGKKTIAQYIFYEAMKKIQETLNKEPLEILKKAIENATPSVEVRSKRIGGTTYQVPVEVKAERAISLSLKFLINAARERPGRNMIIKLGNEILDAYDNTGGAVKKKKKFIKKQKQTKHFQT
uniref:Small ribosomal subunit protein uS7c n=1 Tax=Euglena hiemalis TaxID=392896 RepID=A0A345UC59_9EUGL|nr:ribosomal protein S7 [Euglena hiemalis]AXI98045.1 ribosomal protein S7 [Euglena hiemalis]